MFYNNKNNLRISIKKYYYDLFKKILFINKSKNKLKN